MKIKVLLLVLFVMFVGSQLFAQTSGGPDIYGYTWKNQAAVGGPVYNWKEIKGVGTKITGLADDNRTGPYNINWNFHSYWNDYNKFWVGSNGWISFQGTTLNIAAPFLALPSANSKNTICPLLADLTFVNSAATPAPVPQASAWYWSNNVDTLIVQYDSIPFWVNPNPGYAGRNTFQVVLSGVDSSITFQYKLYAAATPTYDITGEGLETGIENSTGSIGLQVLNNTYPASNTAVKFYPPHPVTYQVIDVAPAWNQYSDNGGFFVSNPCGKPVKMKTAIANTGNQPVTNVPVTGQILDPTFTPIWSSSASVHSLLAGADTVLTYPATYAANTPGDYSYRTTTSLSSDINSGNDLNDVEMVVADTTQDTIHFSFCTATTTTTGLSWQGGNGGGATYFIPPFYPATVTSIDYYIASDAGAHTGFSAELIKDNGLNGNPGTVIDSIGVPKASISATAGYHKVMLPTPYIITSGGVYAAWMMNGDSISLGSDQAPPFSNRNLEYISGSWASYRNNSAEDLMIRLNIKGSNTAPVINATSVPSSCSNSSNGSASVVVTGGTPPYSYSWSNGQTTTTATGLSPGIYTVTITHSGCSRTATDTVTSPAVLVVNATPGAASATATSSGGTPAYTYSWNTTPVQNTQTATGLAAGTYTVCVTDSKGCTSCNTVTVINGAGVNEIYGGASIVISPNPFTSAANINISLLNPEHQNLFFTIYDIYGREIKSVDLSNVSSNPTIDFTLNRGYDISSGLYFYKLHNNTHILTTGKLMVQ